METAWRTLRLSVRRLAAAPAPSLIIIITLALGIGAAGAIFDIFQTLVLQPLPFEDPERLVRVYQTYEPPGQEPLRGVVTARNLEQWRDRLETLSDMGAARYLTLNLSGGGEPERVVGIGASHGHFTTLGVEPLIGRGFRPEEDRAGAAAPVAVISHSLWNRRFGADPEAVGRDLRINGQAHTVIGVMPPGFRYPYSAEVWVPLALDVTDPEEAISGLNVTARLAPGIAVETAREEVAGVVDRLREAFPDRYARRGATVQPIREVILEGVDRHVLALFGGALFVLLIATANVASMILARSTTARQEMAVRLALGSGTWRLARNILADCLLLALVGCGLGLILASWGIRPLAGMSPVDDLGPYFQDLGVGLPVIAFALAVSVLVAGVVALPTVLSMGSGHVAGALTSSRGGGLGKGQRRTFDGLVVAEVAVAVVLLTGAGLMVQSLQNLWSTPTGMRTDDLWSVSFAPSQAGYDDPSERMIFLDEVFSRVRTLPGVESATITNFNPFKDQGWGQRIWPEGRIPSDPSERITVNHRAVFPGYFETTGTRILKGRGFTSVDGPDAAPVAVVAQDTAQRLWGGEEVVGRRVREGGPDATGPWITIVGVVENVDDYGDVEDTWYRPLAQDPREFGGGTLEILLRVSGDPDSVIRGVRGAVRDLHRDLPLFDVLPMEAILGFERRTETFTTVLLSIFASVGMILAAVGIYGVLSYAVGRRLRELGIRAALGAGPGALYRLVVSRGMALAGLGLTIGAAAAAGLTRFLESFLHGVDPTEPGVFALMAVGTLLVAGLAASVPAIRATRVDPTVALSGE